MISFKVAYSSRVINMDKKIITIERLQSYFNYPIEIIEAGTLLKEENNVIIENFNNFDFYNDKLKLHKSFYIKRKESKNCIICFNNTHDLIKCNICSGVWCYECETKIRLCPQCRTILN